MKKIFMLILICLFSCYSFAQLEKGGWITTLNGRGSYSNHHSDFINTTLAINPGVMKLIGKNLGVGISLGSTMQWQRYPVYLSPNEITKTRQLSLEAGPVLRKYFGDYRFKPYAEFGIGWRFDKGTHYGNDNLQYTYHSHNFYIRPVVGISYWISDRISIDLNAGFDYIPDYNHGDWLMNIGFSIRLGK